MVESLVERGISAAEAERLLLIELEAETEAEKAAREAAEAEAERLRRVEQDRAFARNARPNLPGMGAMVRTRKKTEE